jgi:hypothetical protein
MDDNEEWKNVEDFENYEVSNLGRVKNKNTCRILKACNHAGYFVVGLSKTKVKTCSKIFLVFLVLDLKV